MKMIFKTEDEAFDAYLEEFPFDITESNIHWEDGFCDWLYDNDVIIEERN